MKRNHKLIIVAVFLLAVLLLFIKYLRQTNIAVLSPAGSVGIQQRDLMYLAVGLSMIVVIPVYFMLFFFAWRYREGNKKARYQPEFVRSRVLESVWWGVPLIIITVLAVVAFQSSHKLDPYKPLPAAAKPLNIQVVALQWRWLFIYPEQGIATVNLVQFPQSTPVKFSITADAPMNSFWIPALGGQIYAMSGMSTELNLIADKTGSYHGVSANISGKGFAGMSFAANSVSQANFNKWVGIVHQYRSDLNFDAYKQLAKPSTVSEIKYFSNVSPDLYDQVVGRYSKFGHHHSEATI